MKIYSCQLEKELIRPECRLRRCEPAPVTMQVLEFSPMKESRSTWVSLLIRKGMCSLFCPRDRMHSWESDTPHQQNDTERHFHNMPSSDASNASSITYNQHFYSFIFIVHFIIMQQEPIQCRNEPGGKACSTFSARRLRLISAVSTIVCRSLLLTSVPRSFPARSTRENFPWSILCRLKITCRMAWERDELALANVWPDVLEQRLKKNQHF